MPTCTHTAHTLRRKVKQTERTHASTYSLFNILRKYIIRRKVHTLNIFYVAMLLSCALGARTRARGHIAAAEKIYFGEQCLAHAPHSCSSKKQNFDAERSEFADISSSRLLAFFLLLVFSFNSGLLSFVCSLVAPSSRII